MGAGMPDPSRKHSTNQPAPEPTIGRQPDPVRPTSLALPLAPDALAACHGVHRPRVQGQGRPPGQATERDKTMTEASVSFAGNLTDDPSYGTPRPGSQGPCSG
jgi:hypothetical protein